MAVGPSANFELRPTFDFTGGEVVANTIRGGNGTTTFYANGVTVTMTVAAGGATGREVGETTTYSTAQTLVSAFRVTAENVNVTFAAPVEIVGGVLVIDVPRGSTVTFAEPIVSAYTAVRKTGAGQVVFAKANPGFFGTWTQAGGTFDVRSAAFSDNADGFAITTDTLKFAGEPSVTVAPQLKVQGASPQKRVVVCAESDVTFVGGWNSTNGGLVKHGPGTLEIVEPAGTFALGTSNVAAGDGAVSQLLADGVSPADASAKQNDATAGAALQILDGKVVVKGAGQAKTTVDNTQSIFVSTGYSGQRAKAGLEIRDCTYNADGTTRSFNVGHGAGVAEFNHPTLTVKNAKLVSHRMQLAGNTGTSKDIYPTATFENVTFSRVKVAVAGAGADVGTRIPLAKASAVPAGLLGKTTDKAHTVAYSVEDGVLYATLGPKSGMLVIVR